jgi:hypothetical protein
MSRRTRARRGRALTRRYGRSSGQKTFGRVPMGGLFQLKDDPDGAMLQKVGKAAYVVATPGHPGRGVKYPISPNYVIKRGRQ